jgi:hypothetical protein
MTKHKHISLGFGHEIVASHDPEDGSVSVDLRRGFGDSLVRITAYGPGPMLGAGLELTPHGAGEEPVRLHLHALLFRLYLLVGGDTAEKVAARLVGRREVQVNLDASVVEGTDGPDLMIDGAWFADRWHARRGDPRFTVLARDLVFGRLDVQLRKVEESIREVPLPEGIYEVSFIRYERTERRARWPFAKRSHQVTMTAVLRGPTGEDFIPVPGKSERWYGVELAAETIDAAVGELVADVLEHRRRHGGLGWKAPAYVEPAKGPEEPPPAAAA